MLSSLIWSDLLSCYVMLCHVMSCYVMSCYVMLCHVMSCYVMLCHVMSCCVMSCYVMLCRVMLDMYTYVYQCIYLYWFPRLPADMLTTSPLSGLAKACSQSCRHARGGPLEGHGELLDWLKGKPTGYYIFFPLNMGEKSFNISLHPMILFASNIGLYWE